jgi:hypothetical protein
LASFAILSPVFSAFSVRAAAYRFFWELNKNVGFTCDFKGLILILLT